MTTYYVDEEGRSDIVQFTWTDRTARLFAADCAGAHRWRDALIGAAARCS